MTENTTDTNKTQDNENSTTDNNTHSQQLSLPTTEKQSKEPNPEPINNETTTHQISLDHIENEIPTDTNQVSITTPSGELLKEKHGVIQKTAQGKRFIRVPHSHLNIANIELTAEVQITPVNYNGQLCLNIHTDENRNGITRKLRETRTKRAESDLTIPKKLIKTAGLTDVGISFQSANGEIVVFFDRNPAITNAISVTETNREELRKAKNGSFPHRITGVPYDKLDIGESLWFWYDVIGDEFIFGLDLHEHTTPHSSVELSVITRDNDRDACLVHLPKQVCGPLGVDGALIQWGYNNDRLIGRTCSVDEQQQ